MYDSNVVPINKHCAYVFEADYLVLHVHVQCKVVLALETKPLPGVRTAFHSAQAGMSSIA